MTPVPNEASENPNYAVPDSVMRMSLGRINEPISFQIHGCVMRVDSESTGGFGDDICSQWGRHRGSRGTRSKRPVITTIK